MQRSNIFPDSIEARFPAGQERYLAFPARNPLPVRMQSESADMCHCLPISYTEDSQREWSPCSKNAICKISSRMPFANEPGLIIA